LKAFYTNPSTSLPGIYLASSESQYIEHSTANCKFLETSFAAYISAATEYLRGLIVRYIIDQETNQSISVVVNVIVSECRNSAKHRTVCVLLLWLTFLFFSRGFRSES